MNCKQEEKTFADMAQEGAVVGVKPDKDTYVIAVDLDGTLAEYHGWKGEDHIGKPVAEMVKRVHEAHQDGCELWIFSARCDNQVACEHIDNWLKEHDLHHYFKGQTNAKHKFFKEFWDDRAVQIEKNEGIRTVTVVADKAVAATKMQLHPSSQEEVQNHYHKMYKGVKLDPARICSIYGITNVLQGAIIKKALKCGERGHKGALQDLDDIILAARRMKEMIQEDQNDS